jgi:hypothetical protein
MLWWRLRCHSVAERYLIGAGINGRSVKKTASTQLCQVTLLNCVT